MIRRLNILNEVLKNVEVFDTKEMIIHEIKSMIKEAENQLAKDEIEFFEYMLEDEFTSDEEKVEIEKYLDDMKIGV